MGTDITFLSGLPRTGSTLLLSILRQNPKIYAHGTSGLCDVMWDMQLSSWNTVQLKNTPEIPERLLKAIPNLFYNNIDSIVIDKCRAWTLPANLELIHKYITESPKFIVMLRPIVDIVKSFVFIRKMNGWKNPEEQLLDDNSEPIVRSLAGVKYSKSINTGQFLYIWYDEFILNPQETIDKIYNFYGWDKFEHTYTNLKNTALERDDLIESIGLHDIRPEISKRKFEVELSDELYEKAIQLDKELGTL